MKNECVDPRFKYVARDCAEYVEWLGQKENPAGKGWAAGAGYGAKIITILNAMIGIKSEAAEPRKSGTVCVRHGQILTRRKVHSIVWKMPRGVQMKMKDIPYLMNPVK